MTTRNAVIERLSTQHERSMIDLFGPDYFVHSGFAQVVQRVFIGEEPNAVIADLSSPRPPAQMSAANTGWSHDGQLGD